MSCARRTVLAAALLLGLPGLPATPALARTGADGDTAAPPELPPPAQLQARARFTWFGLHVYDMRLWHFGAPVDDGYATQDFALELIYARALDGRAIAERSLGEMRRQGPLDDELAQRWLAQMQAAFPDVVAGDRLTGLARREAPVRFFHNGRPTRAIDEAGFAARFFGIWLAPQTSRPDLRRVLLGARSGAGA